MVIAQRCRLARALAELGLEAPRSDAHFVWMRVNGMTSHQLAAAFQSRGVIVFPGAALGDAEHVRVSLKSAPATDRLLSVLADVAGAHAYLDLAQPAA